MLGAGIRELEATARATGRQTLVEQEGERGRVYRNVLQTPWLTAATSPPSST